MHEYEFLSFVFLNGILGNGQRRALRDPGYKDIDEHARFEQAVGIIRDGSQGDGSGLFIHDFASEENLSLKCFVWPSFIYERDCFFVECIEQWYMFFEDIGGDPYRGEVGDGED